MGLYFLVKQILQGIVFRDFRKLTNDSREERESGRRGDGEIKLKFRMKVS